MTNTATLKKDYLKVIQNGFGCVYFTKPPKPVAYLINLALGFDNLNLEHFGKWKAKSGVFSFARWSLFFRWWPNLNNSIFRKSFKISKRCNVSSNTLIIGTAFLSSKPKTMA